MSADRSQMGRLAKSATSRSKLFRLRRRTLVQRLRGGSSGTALSSVKDRVHAACLPRLLRSDYTTQAVRRPLAGGGALASEMEAEAAVDELGAMR